MKINQVLVEATGATVAFAFGRFNPAHQGHIEVWRTVEQAGANWFIGTNATTLGPNDPLTFEQKSAWMTEIYPAIQGHIVAQTNVLTLAAYIFKKTRKNENATVAYITDAADWAWSGKLLNQYNGVEGAHGYYKFAQIIHEPSPRVSSATALRDAARADDRVAFYHASGTDPKSKVAGLTYFDTVKRAVEKYPLPVKRVKKVKEQGAAEGLLKEFAPGNGGGESGRWYTDDQITDIVGDGWYNDLDVSGDIPKQQMIQQAQAWLDDQGYNVQVLNCKVNDDDMEWYIEGSFQNSRFAKKGMAEAKADPTGTWVVYDGSKITKFKTHNGAKAYAEKNGGTVASSEYYYDKIQKQGVAEDSLGLKKLHDTLWTVISEQTIDEETINEIDPGMIANLYSVFPTVAKIIVSNALDKARKEAKETSIMIDVMKKHANNQPVTPEENEAMKTQFKDIVSYGLSAVAGVLTGAVAGPAAGAGVALAGAYKKELLTLLQTKGPQVLIGLLKSKGKLDVVGILSANLLGKHALPFYAAPKVAEGQLNELAGYGSEKGYTKLDSYKRYDVYVSKQKFNNLYYIAVAENPRSLTANFKAKGKNPQEAVQNLHAEVDKEIDVATKVSGRAIIDFNVDFVRDIMELSTDTFYAKIISGPKLVLAGPEMMEYPDIMSSEGFKPSAIRTYKGGEGTTKLPAVPLSTSAAVTANLIANGRYVLGNEEADKDGNRVFNLEFDSVVQDKNEKLRLRAPALTIGTARVSEETELTESTSLQTTIKAITNDIGEPVTATYETLKFLAKKYIKDNGEFDRGWRMVAMGPGAAWVEKFYATKLKNELYDLLVYNKKDTVDLRDFLWGEYTDDNTLETKRSFNNISQALPPILAELGVKLNAPQITKNANRWIQNLNQYRELIQKLEQDSNLDSSQINSNPSTPKSTVPGQQNAQVEKIVNDILAKLPRNVAGEIRNIVARSSNKLQALQQELTNRNLSVKESTEQKTQAKTWDQMTPQEKSSGVKGRTVWNEKTQRYYTVFDVPVSEVDEASLATMRDYFAGDENARDPYDITKQRLHFSKDKNGRPTVDKRFRSPAEYQAWLKQNKLQQISGANESTNNKGWSLTNKRKQ